MDNITSILSYVVSPILCLIGAIIGGKISAKATKNVFEEEKKSKERLSATILLHDLKSIERFLREENKPVKIRYSEYWQSLVAECTFLLEEDIEWLYKLYDEVFNYDFCFDAANAIVGSQSEQNKAWGLIHAFSYQQSSNIMRKMMFDEKGKDTKKLTHEYDSLISRLQEKAKQK